MNPLKKLAGQTAIYGLPSIVLRIVGYFLTPLYTRVLDEGNYGAVVYMYSLVAFFNVILTYGLETAFFRFINGSNDKRKVYASAFTSLFVSSLLFLVIVLLFSGSISEIVDYQSHKDWVVYFGLILSLDALSALPFARLRSENKASRFALVKSVNILVNVLFNLLFLIALPAIAKTSESNPFGYLVRLFYSDQSKISYIFISNLIASLITLFMLRNEMRIKLQDFDFLILKKLLRYGVPLLFAGLAGIANETLDRVLLRHMLPENVASIQLGIYGANYKVAILITLFIQAYRYAAEPFFFSQAKNVDAKKTYSQMMTYFVLIISFLFLATMLYLDVVMYLIGKPFRVGQPVVPILMLANIFLGIYVNLSIWYKLTNQTVFGMLLSFGGAFVTILLNVLLIPKMGYMGSGWATFACYFVMMVLSYYFGQKYYPVRYNLRKIVLYLGLALFLYFFTFLTDELDLINRLVIHTIMMVFYLMVVLIIEFPNLKRHKQSENSL